MTDTEPIYVEDIPDVGKIGLDDPVERSIEALREKSIDLRRNAESAFRAMQGWNSVKDEAEWVETCEQARADFVSGRFIIERLGAERHLDPALMGTVLGWRDGLIADMQLHSTQELMVADLAVLSFYNLLRVQAWVGNLSLFIERDFFVHQAPTGVRTTGDVEQLVERLLPLLTSINNLFLKNVRAISDLRRGPVPTIAVGQVNVASVQSNTVANGHGRIRRS